MAVKSKRKSKGRTTGKRKAAAKRKPAAKRGTASKAAAKRKPAPKARGSRQPARPTWTRSARRAAIFAAGLFLFVLLAPLGGTKPTPLAAAFQAAMFFVFLVPFGYLTDGFIYNRWLKRQQG